jgi:hypothetical protein
MADVTEILRELEYFRAPFPSAVVADAISHKEEITPHLLSILKEAAENPEAFGEGEYCGHLFALFLLAKFREERAWPLVVKIVSRPGGSDDILGGVITEGLSAIMASVCGEDLPGLKALIGNAGINEWVRAAAMHTLVRLVGAGLLERDEAMQYFSGLFQSIDPELYDLWNVLATCCVDLCPEEVLDEINHAVEEGLIEEEFFGQFGIKRALALGKEGALKQVREGPLRQTLIDDVEEEMSWMSGFEPKRAAQPAPQGIETVVRSGPKIGRNDRCPCGSGKKYKKCCGA